MTNGEIISLKELHTISAYNWWQGQLDYDEKITCDTYEEAISGMARFLVKQPALPETISYHKGYEAKILIEQKEFTFTSDGEECSHQWSIGRDIKNHTDYIIEQEHQQRKRIKEQQEKEAALIAKQHAAEMEIYEKVKKRLGN